MQPFFDSPDDETVQEICMIAPTEQLARKARGIIEKRGNPIDVFVCNRKGDGPGSVTSPEDIVNLASSLQQRGAKLFLSRKGTQQIVERALGIQVVGLNNTLTDYMKMILDNQVGGGLIAFFSYGALSDEVMLMCEMLRIRAKNYIFSSPEDSYDAVAAAVADGATYGIGGAWTSVPAAAGGLPHAILENSSESIVNALDVALQIRAIQREEAVKQRQFKTRMEMYQAVLNATHDAIISVNEQGTVQVVNPVAERIIGKSACDLLGHPIEEVLPNTKLPEVLRTGRPQTNQIMQFGKTLTNTNRLPILVDNDVRGVVATFQDIRQLQTTEQKIRLKLHEKGLVAKYTFADILGASPAILSTIQIAKSYATSSAAVLIHGETGVGKELFAQSIHNRSSRRNGPFVALNCAAVANNLLESELFGYEEGAFTGASRGGREGLFELSHGGTIFLDEIGEISTETQVALLRVLQEKEIRRVGGSRVIPVDVRVITATNRDLIEEILKKRFREDLYYRLNVLDLEIPPLRERGRDVEILGLHFFKKLSGTTASERHKRFLEILNQVGQYDWYGNIRELQNFAERVHILLKNGAETFDVMTEMMRRRSLAPAAQPSPGKSDEHERQAIAAALAAYPNSVEEAARSLGCSRQTLWRKMKKFGLSR
ncbi:sigma 54-interacting transcriptional regulator [Oscillibacter sp.]|uniref:sigma 54-interacting transcriptional regulator n=1 Tax=Oscillibacter sp. TaxID=1945593 RepID=UPI0028AD48C9|nr:sigma 54-interacting transcriptional regulator [Oscillibacter sp.]